MDEKRLAEIEARAERSADYHGEHDSGEMLDIVYELTAEIRRLKEFEPSPDIYLTPAERDKLQQEKNAICRYMVDRFTSPPEK